MNPRVPRTIAYTLGWILALQYATTAFAQSAAASENAGSQQSVASTPASSPPSATSTEDRAPSKGTSEKQENTALPPGPRATDTRRKRIAAGSTDQRNCKESESRWLRV